MIHKQSGSRLLVNGIYYKAHYSKKVKKHMNALKAKVPTNSKPLVLAISENKDVEILTSKSGDSEVGLVYHNKYITLIHSIMHIYI